MFEVLDQDVGERFGLGDRQEPLRAALLAVIFDERSGGIAGLLAKLRQHGSGDATLGWIGNPNAPPAQPQTIQAVLGAETVADLATRLDLPRETALAAAAVMLPRLIGQLTPQGRLPLMPPASVGRFLARFERADAAPPVLPKIVPPPEEGPALAGWIRWGLLIAVLLTLGHCVFHHVWEQPTMLVPPTWQKSPSATDDAHG